jgi:gamma-D-glutamyl-L-lysine dipeptidyl-peptidase
MESLPLISQPVSPKGLDESVFTYHGHRGEFAYVALPLVPLRAQPSERAEQVSQLLHGQYMLILEHRESWVFVRVLDDGYEGWCNEKMVVVISENRARQAFADPRVLTISPLSLCETVNGQAYLPAGSRLLNGERVLAAAALAATISHLSTSSVTPTTLAMGFLNAPYLWGGKSVLGMDCSGLVQVTFAMCGMLMPRDARQQALLGTQVDNLADATAGDLAFFHNEEGRVVHVGLLLEGKRIIHASGWVRIDRWDEQGIFDGVRGVYSHRLQQIRRIII